MVLALFKTRSTSRSNLGVEMEPSIALATRARTRVFGSVLDMVTCSAEMVSFGQLGITCEKGVVVRIRRR